METCWFLQTGCIVDFAAWTQAIGSVVAIFVAILVAWYQNCQARKLEENRANARMMSQTQVGHLFVTSINLIFDEAYKAGLSQEIHKIKLQQKKLQDLIEWSKIFAIDTFHFEKMNSFVRIREKAFEIMLWMETPSLSYNSGAREVQTAYREIADDIFSFGVNLNTWIDDELPTP